MARLPARARRPEAPELQAAIRDARPSWAAGEAPDLPGERARTAGAYRAWVERAGHPGGGVPGRGRVDGRAALRARVRAARAARLRPRARASTCSPRSAPPAATSCAPANCSSAVGEDATTEAAKRVLVSGDKLLLERRARELAEACDVPLAALDRGLAIWGTPGEHADLAARGAGVDPSGALAAVSAQAVPAPPRPASATAGGRVIGARRPGGMTLLLLGCLAVGAAVAADGVGADLRPVGVDHLGPRGRCTSTS